MTIDRGEQDELVNAEAFLPSNQQLVACVPGIVSRVNKLISVIPLKQVYIGEVGDLIIGRITEVASKKWKVEIGGSREAALMLSSVNLPGGVQRIRTYEDQLQMRSLYVEGDLVSGEVQTLMGDGTASIHARSLRYGKLENGVLCIVPSGLVKRMKHHFVTLPSCGVDVLLGCNGYIWIARTVPKEWQKEDEEAGLPLAETLQKVRARHSATVVSDEERASILRIRNAIEILKVCYRYINAETIMEVFNKSLALGLGLNEMLRGEAVVACSEGTRVEKK